MHVLFVHQNYPAQFGHVAALKARPDIRPDLVVGHSGFGSTLYLDFRPEFPVGEQRSSSPTCRAGSRRSPGPGSPSADVERPGASF